VFGQASIISSIISAILLAINPDLFIYWISIFIPLQFIYTAYCYYRTFQMTLGSVLKKSIISIGVIIGLYLAVVIVGIVIGIALKIAGVF